VGQDAAQPEGLEGGGRRGEGMGKRGGWWREGEGEGEREGERRGGVGRGVGQWRRVSLSWEA